MPQFRFPRVACLALILTLLAHAVAAASDAVPLQPGKPGRTIGPVDWSRGWAVDGAPTLVGHAVLR